MKSQFSLRRTLLAACLAALAMAALPASAWAQKVDSGIVIGESARVWSETLQEERRLLIQLPPHYAQTGRSYPVLYLLDAESQFQHSASILQFLADAERMPEVIVVGITNTQRVRDLTPVTRDPELLAEDRGEMGGAEPFLKFLVDELAPWVNTRYRTQPYNILVGHSLGGLFAVQALLTRPEAFQAYIAISPSLWWDKRAMVARAKAGMGRIPDGRHYLRLTWGDKENDIRDSTQELVDWLKANPPGGVQWDSHYYPGDDHSTTPHRSLYDGMEALFAGWTPRYEIDDVKQKNDLAAIETHYAALSRKYGYTVQPSAYAIYQVSETLMENKEHAAALELLRRNVREYPWLADVHEQLGEALEKLGRPEEALLSYRQALRLSIGNENAYNDPISDYRRHVNKLRGKPVEQR